MNKFEIGSQWRTRGGWRAVVVDVDKSILNDKESCPIKVWHDNRERVTTATTHGRFAINDDEHDLIDPWSEPRDFEVWVEIHQHKDGTIGAYAATSEEELKISLKRNVDLLDLKTLATQKFIIKDGERYNEPE